MSDSLQNWFLGSDPKLITDVFDGRSYNIFEGRDRPKEGNAQIMAGLALPALLRSRALLRNPYAGGGAVCFVSRYATWPRRQWRLLCNALNFFRRRRTLGGLALPS
jgi:hypothetical protein